MATRSIIAIPEGDSWKGRYVHWDGYPSHMAESISEIVRRDGLEKAIKIFTGAIYGWSRIDPSETGNQSAGDHQSIDVKGYGSAYAEVFDESWLVPDSGCGTEWVYVLTTGGLLVIKEYWNGPDEVVGLFSWDEQHDWHQIEFEFFGSEKV